MRKALALLLSSLLLVMSALQYNDIDGAWWMIVYAVAAAVPVCQTYLVPRHSRLKAAVFYAALTLTLLALIRSLPEVNFDPAAVINSVNSPMSAATPYIEGNRELFGGLIALAVILGFRYSRASIRSA